MELNGVANIMMLVDQLEEMNKDSAVADIALKIESQLDYLERYILACNDAKRKGTPLPQWHDIVRNPKLYRTNKVI